MLYRQERADLERGDDGADDFEERVAGVASLAEPQRRALYRFVVTRDGAVSKDEAAAAMGMARSVAAFHLDRLVADGLLTTEYRRLSGRQGPGAGRPAKLYRRAEGELSVSLPPRRYDLAARLLAAAVDDATRTGIARGQCAHDRRHRARTPTRRADASGRRQAADPPRSDRCHPDGAQLTRLRTPRLGNEVVLANCPFHALVNEQRDLVCGMNHDLLAGMADAVGDDVLAARLEPTDGACCVRLAPDRPVAKGQ